MSRKHLSLLAVIFLLALSGCGRKQEVSEPPAAEMVPADAEEKSKEPAVPEAAPVAYDDSLIRDIIDQEGSFQARPDDQVLEYSYHIPQLIGDTNVISEINREIDERFGSLARENLERIQNGEKCQSPRVTWESRWKDSLLSLCMECDDRFPCVGTEFYVINYDFKTDKRLDNQDMLAYVGVDEDTFLWAARRAAMQEFDSRFRGDPDREDFIDLYYSDFVSGRSVMGRRASLLESITLENVQIFLDGDLCRYIIPEKTDVYAERTYYIYDLDFEPSFDVKKKVSDGIVAAVLENNKVYVTFEESDVFEMPEIWKAKPNTRYQVQGLYSDYQNMFLATVGGDYTPYLFLVTQESGNLEFVDLFGGAECGVFCAMPIAGEVSVAGGRLFADRTAMQYGPAYDTVYAEDSCGERYDMYLWTGATCRTVPVGGWYGELEYVPMEDGSYGYSVIANLNVEEEGHFRLNVTALDEEIVAYDGQMQALGMTEEGLLCEYALWDVETHDCKIGVFTCRDTDEIDGETWYEVLQMKVFSGDAPYGFKEEWTSFYRIDEGDYLESSAVDLFVGEWWDSWSSRCHMTITETEDPDRFHICIGWSDSAFTGGEWNMTGVYVSNGYHTALEFDDCVQTTVAYHVDYNEVIDTVYTGGSGCISLSEPGTLLWEDYMYNAGEMCVFKRPSYWD